jgi:LmeA-like phospholipid-binding
VARRGRRIGIAFLIVFVVLATLAVIGDRVAASTAEREIAKQAVKEMNARGISSAKQPAASIGGFPFLTQVARGRYDKVTIEVDQPRTDVVRLNHLTVVATDVHAPTGALMSGTGRVTADKVTGVATMDWDAVRSLLDLAGLSGIDPKAVQLTVTDNNVRLRIPLLVAGQEFVVLAGAKLAVSGGVVRLQVTEVKLENGEIPPFLQGVINTLKQRLQVAIRVPALPYKLTINSVQSTEAGVMLNAAAEQVVIAGGSG